MRDGVEVVSWRLVYTKQAQKDAKKLSSSGLRPQAERLLRLLAEDPFRVPPPYETLVGNLKARSLGESTFSIALSIKSFRKSRP